MAGGKLSPRQKMIGMMYLVLTALLALNVSKDILKSFVVVNNGLENTEKTFNKDVGQLYAQFDEKKTIDPLRVMENWKKAQQARKMTAELNLYIKDLQKRLIRETEGFKHKEEDTIHLAYVESKDNFDTPTHILIGESEDGSAGEARVLKTKLIAFKRDMLALLPEADRKQMNLTIETDDPKGEEEDSRTWEMNNFYHSPLAASVTILSKFQTDIKSAESDIVDALLKNVDADVIPFDTVAARVVAQSNYVLTGDNYNADIFLAAFNKTLRPKVMVGSDSITVDHGMGRYNVAATSEGIKTYEGTISMKTPKGSVLTFPFKSEYIVARPALNVGADKMNVLYAGVTNPVTISVPGVPNERLHVSLDNGSLRMTSSGKYDVTNAKAGFANFNVSATMEDGTTRSMGSIKYRVKMLPDPIAKVAGSSGGKKLSSDMASAPGLVITYPPDFDFGAKPTFTSGNLSIIKNGIVETIPLHNVMFDQSVRNKLSHLSRGCVVLFEDLKATGPDQRTVSLQPISFTIK